MIVALSIALATKSLRALDINPGLDEGSLVLNFSNRLDIIRQPAFESPDSDYEEGIPAGNRPTGLSVRPRLEKVI